MGDLLKRKNHSDGVQYDSVDTMRPNKNIGVVQARTNTIMEELIPSHGDKRETRVFSNEGQSLVDNFKPIVEISHGQVDGSGPSIDQHQVISTKIKCANFEKIPIRGRERVDPIGDHSEDDSPRQTYRVHDDGQPLSSEAPTVCRTGDQWEYSH